MLFGDYNIPPWVSLVAHQWRIYLQRRRSVRDTGLIPGLGRSLEEENGKPLQYSCLENPMYRGTWQASLWGHERVKHDLATKKQQHPSPVGSTFSSITHWVLCILLK